VLQKEIPLKDIAEEFAEHPDFTMIIRHLYGGCAATIRMAGSATIMMAGGAVRQRRS
jgi:hypothetical protein